MLKKGKIRKKKRKFAANIWEHEILEHMDLTRIGFILFM